MEIRVRQYLLDLEYSCLKYVNLEKYETTANIPTKTLSSEGLNLIQQQTGLPLNTFISAEAVLWCNKHVAGAETTLQVDLYPHI